MRFWIFFFFASWMWADTPLTAKIPLRLWQTAKSHALSESAKETQQTWLSLNPEFSYLLFDDADIERYIGDKWPSDYLDLFRALPIGAMKADLWRYLVLTSEGGVYSDIDSVCLMPIRDWPLKGTTEGPHVLLIDLDNNQSQFCQWTFAATPHHPVLKYVCDYLLKRYKKRGISRNPDGLIDVLGVTGPAIFSAAIKSFLQEPQELPASTIVKKYFKDKKYRKRLNHFGIFFTRGGFFSGEGAKNLFWGSWVSEMKERANIERQE